MKFGEKEILHNYEYEAISVTVDKTTTGTVVEKGRTILKAGTPLLGDNVSIWKDRTKKVKKATANTAVDGILLHDIDLTDGDVATAMVYRGTVRSDRVAGYSDELATTLKHIRFIAGV